MMTAAKHKQNLDTILDSGLIAVIRIQSHEALQPIIKALYNGGIKAVEITMTTPGAMEAVREASQLYKDKLIIGAGTILDPHTARAAILAGAEFIVSPVFHTDVVSLCRSYSVISVPGTYTPTEILTAWEAGADIVKVFPAPSLGSAYFKDVLAPLPHVRLLPTGVSLDTVDEYIKTGVACLSAGGTLITPQAVANQDWNSIRDLANAFLAKITESRKNLGINER